jgi:hypothetical protein
MLTCKSPRTVLLVAHALAERTLPRYSCLCSRHDFTLPQLFACLVLKEFLHLSYRRAESFLRDCEAWRTEIQLPRAPDHNTLQRAAVALLQKRPTDAVLQEMVRQSRRLRLLGLSRKPLAIDSSCYESHHVSRHYERRCRETRSNKRSETVRRIPKLTLAVASASHFILALHTSTGSGSDHAFFEPVLAAAVRRAYLQTVVADAGYDSEANHCLARQRFGVRAIIPPLIGRPTGRPPNGRWRRHMYHRFRRRADHRSYGQRWQVETVNSMMKRNLGSALRGRSESAQHIDLRLKVLTHNVMILKRRQRVETEHSRPLFATALRSARAEARSGGPGTHGPCRPGR